MHRQADKVRRLHVWLIKARQALTYVHSRSRRPSGAAMRMVRLSRDASKQDEARELLAPVYRSVEPRPILSSFIDNAWTGASYAQTHYQFCAQHGR